MLLNYIMKKLYLGIVLLLFPLFAFGNLDLSGFPMDYSGIPALEKYTARDGMQLGYRFYPSNSDKLVILIHGSTGDSRYLMKLAKALSEGSVAKVITPDLRGHGLDAQKRGDVDYIGQYEDDIIDLIQFVREQYALQELFLGGHSAGAGLALRFAESGHQDLVDGFVFLSPFIGGRAPTTKQDAGFAEAKIARMIGLSILNKIGIHAFDHTKVLHFNVPEQYWDGHETLDYSYAATVSIPPNDYKVAFESLKKPAILITGENDEVIVASEFSGIVPKTEQFELLVIPGNHFVTVLEAETIRLLSLWLKEH